MIRIDTELGKSGEIVIEGAREELVTELVFMLEALEEHLGNVWIDAVDEFLRRKVV